jgi:hypothetical protein
LFFFLAIVVMRMVRRFVLPFLFRKAGERMFNATGSESRQDFDSRKEGEVRVDMEPKTSEKVEEADFVEYEEL